MQLYEISINGEVLVSSDKELFVDECINTLVLENNLYGKVKFLSGDFFYIFSEGGPKRITIEEVREKLKDHKE